MAIEGPDPARRNERARRAILTAALDLVGTQGYEKTSVEAIAARAGVGKQTIYRWWPSKGAVVLDAFLEPRVDATGTEAFELDSGDLDADVRRFLRATVAEFATPAFEAPYRAVIVALQHDPELAAQTRERVLGPSMAVLRRWLATARKEGRLREGLDLDVAVELLVGPLFHRWLLGTKPLTRRYADKLADAALAALLPPNA